MKAEYKRDWSDKTVILFEHEIEFNGCSFLVIFGKHVNGQISEGAYKRRDPGHVCVRHCEECANTNDQGCKHRPKLPA